MDAGNSGCDAVAACLDNLLVRHCSDCGKAMARGIIFDWIQRLPWCAECFKRLLADQRAAAQVE